MGLWEVAWETQCASFPGLSAGLLHLLASIQQPEPLLEQGFQLSPHTCTVRRAETSAVGLCFRSRLCVEASWPGTSSFAERSFLLFFFCLRVCFSLVLQEEKRNPRSYQQTQQHAQGSANIDGFCTQ